MIFIVVLAMAFTQDTARAPRLELRDAYRIGAERSPRIAAANARARASLARIRSSKTLPDPQIQLGVMNYALPELRPMESVGMTQLQVMQMVPVAGKLGLAGNVASARAAADRERSRDTGWELRSSIAAEFYEIYKTDRSLVIQRETLALLRNILSTTESMYRVGEARQADVLRAQVEIGRMAQDTVRMVTMRRATLARLEALTDTTLVIETTLLPAFPQTIPALDDLITSALRGRPILLAGEGELEASREQRRLASREIWPDITFGFQYGQRNGLMGVERMGSFMVGASIPVFARGRQLAMRQEADAMEQMSRSDLAVMQADTKAQVTEAYANLTRARALTAMYRTTILPQAEAAAASALAAYRVGSVDFMTLLDDRMNVNRYEIELAGVEADEGLAWAEIEALVATELFVPHSSAPAPQRTSP